MRSSSSNPSLSQPSWIPGFSICTQPHHEIPKYYQSTRKARVEALQSLTVQLPPVASSLCVPRSFPVHDALFAVVKAVCPARNDAAIAVNQVNVVCITATDCIQAERPSLLFLVLSACAFVVAQATVLAAFEILPYE